MSYLFLQDPMLKRSTAPRGAFTLIEMLVVIGVIALLAAIMFPVFAKVRENGRRTVCNSNLKQLGMAFAQYAQDYNGRYPLAGQYQKWANADGTNSAGAWVTGGKVSDLKPAAGTSATFALADPTDPFAIHADNEAIPEKGAIFPYVKTPDVYACPSAPDVNKKRLSYSMNCAISGIAQNRIRVPLEIVLLVDEGKTLNDGYFWATGDFGNSPTDALFDGHNGGGNILFADGHVKFFNFNELPLDSKGSKTEAGTGIYLKAATTGAVRFRDPAFGPKAANVVGAIQDVGSTTNTCGETIS